MPQRMSPAVVVVVVTAVLAAAVGQPTKPTQRLWRNFFMNACSPQYCNNETTAVIGLSFLRRFSEGQLTIALSKNVEMDFKDPKKNTQAASCPVRPNTVYQVAYNTSNELIFQFNEISKLETKKASKKSEEDEEEDIGEAMKEMEKETNASPTSTVSCKFSFSTELSIKSGYVFISCRVPSSLNTREMLRAWWKAIKKEDASISSSRRTILVALGAVVASLVTVAIVCVCYRLRPCCPNPRRASNVRRPSQQSSRTRGTECSN